MAGDSATARALAALPAERWRVMHSVHWPARRLMNIDHLVVGPPGVFVIASEQGLGDMAAATPSREAALAGVADAAIAVAELIPGMDPQLVVPVLCTEGEERTSGRIHGVLVCSTDGLAPLLLKQEKVLDRVYVDDLFHRLQRAMPSSTFSTASGSTGTKLLPMGPPRRARRRKTSTRQLPWEPYSQAGPGARAIVGGIICLMVCSVVSTLVWPVANRLIAALASLF